MFCWRESENYCHDSICHWIIMSDIQVSVELVQNFHCKFNQSPVSAALTAVIARMWGFVFSWKYGKSCFYGNYKTGKIWVGFLEIREESRGKRRKKKDIHAKLYFLSVLHKAVVHSFRQCFFRILVSGGCNFSVYILTSWPLGWHSSCLNPPVFRLRFIYSVR